MMHTEGMDPPGIFSSLPSGKTADISSKWFTSKFVLQLPAPGRSRHLLGQTLQPAERE